MNNQIYELLRSKGVSFTTSGQDFLTKCFNPEHNDNNPSFRIDKHTGLAHCFSCGYKTNIFKYYGILTNQVSVKLHKLKEKLIALKELSEGVKTMEGARLFNESFRGISAKTFKHFGMFTTEAVEGMEGRLILPVTDILDKTVVYVGRHMHSNDGGRYKNYPAHTQVPLFPAKLDSTRTMVLVEGMMDMLNLYDKGARNVVCTFGTSKLFNDVAGKLSQYKIMGIEKVFIVFDGDKAGREAAAKTKPLIEEMGLHCEIVSLEDDMDPGDFTEEQVQQLIEYTKDENMFN